ncbi:MAG: LptA/OstA family protein, partial [Mariprofundaceae bacterium]|nr:LptA/OstA family protein [Mariprofundaceae bacterium]
MLPGLAVSLMLFSTTAVAADVDIVADKIVRDAEGIATATGNVEIQRGGETINADKVRYDAIGKRIKAEGHVFIHSAQADIQAASGDMNTEDKSGELTDAEIQLPGGEQITAKRLVRINEYTYQAFQPVMTTCPKDAETWHLYASEGVLDQAEGVFTAKHARFEFAGVPVFYSPYWQHAIRRKSGFMIPFFSYGKRRGTEWALPYYFAPRPNWDATITPHLMTARGIALETELRHASTVGQEKIQLEGLHDKILGRSRGRLQGEANWKLPLNMNLSLKGDEVREK